MIYPLGQISQALAWGPVRQERLSPPDTMFCITGRRIYAIGDIDGRFRPRSNPYDLHAYGRPDPKDPLAGKLQGVWAQPVRGLAGYRYEIRWGEERWKLEGAQRFTQSFACARFDYRRGLLQAVRRDFAAQDAAVLFSTLSVSNQGAGPLDVQVAFTAWFGLEDAWFTQMAAGRNQGEQVTVEAGRLAARAQVLPGGWAAAAGGERPPDAARLLEGSAGELVYHLRLAPGAEEVLAFGMSIDSQAGAAGAREMLDRWLPRHAAVLAENEAFYAELLARGPRLHSPDPALDAAFDLARANLQMLEAQSPALGRYFYAGLEMFPFWFSNDGAYSAAGLLASGLVDAALNHIRIGARHMPAGSVTRGRVPHQISPSGRVAFAGNAQETPLWVMSVWDACRWTGDRAFLEEMYPHALRGMFDYVLGTIDADGDGYPSGPGMVEMEGMGEEKLDSAVYTWAALNALAGMAGALGDAEHARQARERADAIASRFDADWWDAQGGTYAMSLEDPGNRLHPVPHWAVIAPLEVGLATPEHAAQTFAALRAQYLNRWGLKHTVGEDERVWTLPTATLSRAAYRYGERGLGFEMLRHVAETLSAGSIGLFHELIPEGACIIQLWSAATFIRGLVEDLLGITVEAAEHRLTIAPQLPVGWGEAELEGMAFGCSSGAHRISVRVEGSAVTVAHLEGSAPLVVRAVGKTVEIPPGERHAFFGY